MKTTLVLATCALVGVARADAPDFQTAKSTRVVDRSLTASRASGGLDPLDIIPFVFDSSALDGVDRIQIQIGRAHV